MRRSEINRQLRDAELFFAARGFALPAWTRWDPAAFRAAGAAWSDLRTLPLGWDLTDFGSGDFARRGLLLVTLRNGPAYAEKIMRVGPGQETPWHAHAAKTEDIINRGGGTLVLSLAPAAAGGGLGSEPVELNVDGERRRVAAGAELRLERGQSVTLPAGLYHRFWGEGEAVLTGEVSSHNDDENDNLFLEDLGRFPRIEEDEAPYRLLVSDYAAWR